MIVARSSPLLPLETMFAKEDKSLWVLQWKTPRLSVLGRQGIAVRTKWQSGIYVGDT